MLRGGLRGLAYEGGIPSILYFPARRSLAVGAQRVAAAQHWRKGDFLEGENKGRGVVFKLRGTEMAGGGAGEAGGAGEGRAV